MPALGGPRPWGMTRTPALRRPIDPDPTMTRGQDLRLQEQIARFGDAETVR
jgi:hypothetical protein